MKRLLSLLILMTYNSCMFSVMIPMIITYNDQDGPHVIEEQQINLQNDMTVGEMLDAIPQQVDGGEQVRLVFIITKIFKLDGNSHDFPILFQPANTLLNEDEERNKLLVDKITEIYNNRYPGEQIDPIDCANITIILGTFSDDLAAALDLVEIDVNVVIE